MFYFFEMILTNKGDQKIAPRKMTPSRKIAHQQILPWVGVRVGAIFEGAIFLVLIIK